MHFSVFCAIFIIKMQKESPICKLMETLKFVKCGDASGTEIVAHTAYSSAIYYMDPIDTSEKVFGYQHSKIIRAF